MKVSASRRFVGIIATLLVTTIALMLLFETLRSEPAKTISGNAAAIDGQTLAINGGRIRLLGVAAPSPIEITPTDARSALATIARQGGMMTCIPRKVHEDGAVMATCSTSAGQDVGGAIVGAGYARSDPALALYDNAQDRARALGLGIWRQK